MRRSGKALGILLGLVGLLSSCGHIEIPNVEVCATGVGEVGLCKETLSDKERTIPGPQWQACGNPELPCENAMLHMTPEDVGKIFKAIEKFCAKYEVCVGEDIKDAKIFLNRLRSLLNEETN